MKRLDFDHLHEAMEALAEQPEKITEILLGMPRDKYEADKRRLFREAFPDEDSVIQFINDLYIKERIKNIPDSEYRIVNFLLKEQDKIALYKSEFWHDGDITLGEIKERILGIIKDTPSQGEFSLLFKTPKTVEIKKEFAINLGGLDRIERDYKHLLNKELSSGLTLQQHIDKVKDWFNSLHGESLGNWIKLFAFAKAAKCFLDEGNKAINFHEAGQGRYCFQIKKDRCFYKFFIRRDKNSKQFTTKAKKQILKWLHDNQNTVEFPMVISGELWNCPVRIYEYAEGISNNEILFTINTNILESSFRDYVSIDIDEIDNIEELWETKAAQNADFVKYRLNSFIDTPLKFLLTLKQIYNGNGDFSTKSGFEGNCQMLTGENLNNHLGNLRERIEKHLQSFKAAGAKSKIIEKIAKLLLIATWEIALERKWLQSKPTIDSNGTWHFNINPAYFAERATARRLKDGGKKSSKKLKAV